MKAKEKLDQNISGSLMRERTPKLVAFGKTIVFGLLVAVLIAIIVLNSRSFSFGIASWYVNLPVAIVLLAENAIKFWATKNYQGKIVCYTVDILSMLALTVFSDGVLISLLYVIILTEFYLTQKNLAGSIAMCVSSIVLFLVTFALSSAFKAQEVSISRLISSAFNDLMLLIVHFLVINLVTQLTQKNRELAEAVAVANQSNEKLRIAYEELKGITELEERQRIAKDIHDTAGHSITTVIMLTEAAKLAIDSDPEDAKRRITAANLQAKHALEELRESVHLLSGLSEAETLKDQLLNIVHDSTDGTGITIRTDIDDVKLCDAKARFVCNTLKEGISNGLRHGNATAFYFELKEKYNHIEFLLSDNGTGMELSSLKEGFGLTGMHRRAESLGGSVWFDTEVDEGFEIHITLPADSVKGEIHEN